MTSKERFHKTMCYDYPDRVPYFEEGLRSDVIKNWRKQGMPKRNKISDLFIFDKRLEIDLEFDPLSFLSKYPTSTNDLRKLRKKLEGINLYKYWVNYKKKLKKNKKDQIIFLKVHSGFFLSLGIHDWKRFSEAMINLVEKPELVKEAMDLQFEYISKYVELILNDIEVDAIIFNEPIGGNEGPLISPKYYEEFALTKYEPLIKLIKNHKIETVILRSYANVRIMIPILLKYGFNCLWACETECEAMDYLKIRKEFGSELRLIGGIDIDKLRRDKHSIKKELLKKVPPLLKSGGFIPLADGRIRNDITFENYTVYRQLLQDLTKQQ